MLRKFRELDRSEVRKISSIILDQGITSGVSFFTTLILSRFWQINDYANFVLVTSIAVTILGFQRALVSQPFIINRNDFGGKENAEYLHANIWYKLIFTLFVFLFLPFGILISQSYDEIGTLFIFTSYIIAHSSFYFLKDILLGKRETTLNLQYSLFSNAIVIAILIFIFFSQRRETLIFYAGVTLTFLVGFSVFCLRNKEFIRLNSKKLIEFFKPNWKVGKWILGSTFFFSISSQIYPWLLLVFVSKNEVAIYGVLLSISSLVNPLVTSIKTYLLPLFTKIRHDKKRMVVLVKRWVFIFSSLSITMITTGLFVGEEIIELFFGDKFSNLGIIVVLAFVDQGLNILFQPVDMALNALKRTDIGFWLMLFRSVLALVLGLLLVSNFGLIGVFLTRIVENIFFQTVNIYLFKKIIED